MMYKKLILILILLIGTCVAQHRDTEMDDLISSIFDRNAGFSTVAPVRVTPTSTPAPIIEDGDPGPSTYQKCGIGRECVRAYLCSSGTINDDGAKLIDVRIDDDGPEPECPTLETCCSVDDKVDDPIIRPVKTPTACGYRNFEGVGFKIKGRDNEAQFGEFPWMVAIFRVENVPNIDLNIYCCGGSLITPQVVITGAHCVKTTPTNTYKVRAGEWESRRMNEVYPHQDRNIADIIVHESYYAAALYSDIALLFVDVPFDLAPNVNTICLPPPTLNFDSSRCYATGWGKDQFQNGQYQNILKKMDLPVVPFAQCQRNLRTTRLGRYFRLHRSFMCAGGERGKDMCTGDGGSPLVCPMTTDPNRYFQVGIVAWGIGCSKEDIPGVYANVPHLRAWIDQKLARKGINPTYFTA